MINFIKTLNFKIFILIVVFVNSCYLRSIQIALDDTEEDFFNELGSLNSTIDEKLEDIDEILLVQINTTDLITLEKLEDIYSNHIDLHERPCDDFYNYVCGRWVKSEKTGDKTIETIENIYNFRDFKENFKEKLGKESKAIEMINQMNKKCESYEVLRDPEYVRNSSDSYCHSVVRDFENYAFGSYYIHYLVNSEDMDESFHIFIDIFTAIVEESKKLIEKKSNLDDDKKQSYIEKLDKIHIDGRHYENLFNKSLMEECYSYFVFSKDDDVRDMLNKIYLYDSFISNENEEFKKVCVRYIKRQRSFNGIELSDLFGGRPKYFTDIDNFVFSLSLLKHPYFDANFPMSINFGSIGFSIGQVLMNALGIKENNNEKIIDSSIRDSKIAIYYPYNDDEYIVLPANLINTDAIEIAHNAFKNYLEIQGIDNNGSKYLGITHDEHFFLGYGIHFCDKSKELTKAFHIYKEWTDKLPNNPFDLKSFSKAIDPLNVHIQSKLLNYQPFVETFKCKSDNKIESTEQLSTKIIN